MWHLGRGLTDPILPDSARSPVSLNRTVLQLGNARGILGCSGDLLSRLGASDGFLRGLLKGISSGLITSTDHPSRSLKEARVACARGHELLEVHILHLVGPKDLRNQVSSSGIDSQGLILLSLRLVAEILHDFIYPKFPGP